ncbi:hypothetical protein IFR05_003703 [Cadophora sp. M221]|nr:hypothetical protein IFR05_003703 [Cadophora sp. M221]
MATHIWTTTFSQRASSMLLTATSVNRNVPVARAKMPGDYVSGSEYFPTCPASTSPFFTMEGRTTAPEALSMATSSELPGDGISKSVPLQGVLEPRIVAGHSRTRRRFRDVPQYT